MFEKFAINRPPQLSAEVKQYIEDSYTQILTQPMDAERDHDPSISELSYQDMLVLIKNSGLHYEDDSPILAFKVALDVKDALLQYPNIDERHRIDPEFVRKSDLLVAILRTARKLELYEDRLESYMQDTKSSYDANLVAMLAYDLVKGQFGLNSPRKFRDFIRVLEVAPAWRPDIPLIR